MKKAFKYILCFSVLLIVLLFSGCSMVCPYVANPQSHLIHANGSTCSESIISRKYFLTEHAAKATGFNECPACKPFHSYPIPPVVKYIAIIILLLFIVFIVFCVIKVIKIKSKNNKKYQLFLEETKALAPNIAESLRKKDLAKHRCIFCDGSAGLHVVRINWKRVCICDNCDCGKAILPSAADKKKIDNTCKFLDLTSLVFFFPLWILFYNITEKIYINLFFDSVYDYLYSSTYYTGKGSLIINILSIFTAISVSVLFIVLIEKKLNPKMYDNIATKHCNDIVGSNCSFAESDSPFSDSPCANCGGLLGITTYFNPDKNEYICLCDSCWQKTISENPNINLWISAPSKKIGKKTKTSIKIGVWIAGVFILGIINTFFYANDIMLGAIPSVLLFSAMIFIVNLINKRF